MWEAHFYTIWWPSSGSPSYAVLHSMCLFPLLASRTNHQEWDTIPSWSELLSTLTSRKWVLENLTFWWGWTRVSQEVLQPKTRQGEDEEGGIGRERACCLVPPMRQQWNKRLTQWGGHYRCVKTTSGSASVPRECLDNPRSSEKQEGGQSLKDIFVLLLFFFFLLGVGITILVCFLKMSKNCYIYLNPGIWSRLLHLLGKYKWIQKTKQMSILHGSCSGCFSLSGLRLGF